jgi:hypothetical protein
VLVVLSVAALFLMMRAAIMPNRIDPVGQLLLLMIQTIRSAL